RVEATDNVISTDAQTLLYLEFRRLLDRAVRWFLTSRPPVLDIAAEVARFRPGISVYGERMPDVLVGSERTRLTRRARELQGKGIPEDLALTAASLLDAYSVLDCIEIAEDTGERLDDVVGVYFSTSETFSIDAMLTRVSALPRDDRWDALARGALRDDLYAVLDNLARSVLEVSEPQQSPQDRLAQWSERNADALSRARGALGGIERLSHAGIAALSVALRTLRTVTKAGSSGAPTTVESSQAPRTSESRTATAATKKMAAVKQTAPVTKASPTATKPTATKTTTKQKAPAQQATPAKATATKATATKATTKQKAPAQQATPAKKSGRATKSTPATKTTAKKSTTRKRTTKSA
ncbi:MAG: NAD-glutamate dehydrogenase, partial [Terracoccus sp.]